MAASKQRAQAGPTRIAFYTRVSTEDQAEKATVRNQVDYLERKYAVDFAPDSPTPMHLVDTFIDDGFSGAIALAERPEGRRLLETAAAGELDAIVIYKLDRLGRTAKVLLDAHERLEQLGVAIISATEPFDTRTSIGRFVFQLLGSIAELERATIRDRMNLGRDRKAREGKFINGPIPYGYDLDADGYLVPSDRLVAALACTEAEVAREIFMMLANGNSGRRIAQWLSRQQVPSPKRYRDKHGGERELTGTDWGPDRIWRMIQNPLYRGQRVLDHTSGTIQQAVPALVDDATWHLANDRLDRNRIERMSETKYVYLLRGRFFCNGCGLMMQGNFQKDGPHVRLYYGCPRAPGKHRGPATAECTGGYIRGEPIEELILSEIDQFYADPGPALDELRSQLNRRKQDVARHASLVATLRTRLHETATAKDDVMALVRRRRITVDEADVQLEAVERDATEIRAELAQAESDAMLTDAFETQLQETARYLAQTRAKWQTWRSTCDRRQVWAAIQQLVIEVRLDAEGGIHRTYAFWHRPDVSRLELPHDLESTLHFKMLRLKRGPGIAAD